MSLANEIWKYEYFRGAGYIRSVSQAGSFSFIHSMNIF